MTDQAAAVTVLDWLLDGDVSIESQARRDLLDEPRPDLQQRISTEGWGARFLAARGDHGHWGQRYYQPKWISSHYTLLDLRTLELPPGVPEVDETLDLILTRDLPHDPSVRPRSDTVQSDVCLNGMALNICSWFAVPEVRLRPMVDFILSQRMEDGGFNCRRNRGGARHSSMHSTLSVCEGVQTWLEGGGTYRREELAAAAREGREFLLQHRLYRSDRTGEVISPKFLRLSFPGRWFYDVLRALDHFREAGCRDPRLGDAVGVLWRKRRGDGRWNVQAKHPGQTHFDMETAGRPSRWNTLRALRVLRWLDGEGPGAFA